MSGKNVLVTGANGHVGYTLTKILVERGYNVRASVRNKNDPKLVSHLDSLDIELVEMDLMDPESIESAMQNIEGLFQVAAVYQSWAKNPDEDIINPSEECFFWQAELMDGHPVILCKNPNENNRSNNPQAWY